jgi:cobalt-zinc-cadmium efflux system protein
VSQPHEHDREPHEHGGDDQRARAHAHAHDHDGHDHDHDGHDHAGHDHAGHDHAGHAHDHRQLGLRALVVALVVTAGFCAVEAVAGWWTQSLALLSDAAHMLTDSIGLVVAVLAALLRARPRSQRATFGFARLPVLGGVINALTVLGAAVWIVVEAVERLRAPVDVPGMPVVAVAVGGLAVNLFGAWWVHRSGDRSVNTRGAELHMLGDALGSIAAIVSGVVLMTTSFRIVDPIASLVVAGIIGVGAVRLLLEASTILLEHAPRGLDVAELERVVREQPGVSDVVGLHAWELDSGEAVASLVLVTARTDLAELAASADSLREVLERRFRIAHATIEWRPTANPRPCCEAA